MMFTILMLFNSGIAAVLAYYAFVLAEKLRIARLRGDGWKALYDDRVELSSQYIGEADALEELVIKCIGASATSVGATLQALEGSKVPGERQQRIHAAWWSKYPVTAERMKRKLRKAA